MNVAVRYLSRSGNTKVLADKIAEVAGVQAVSIEAADAAITEPVDVLFVGGALYAYGIDKKLEDYLKSLNKENVKKAVVFSTSWISKHSIDLMKKALKEAGIPVEEEAFHAKNRPSDDKLKEAENFAKKFI
ncbi:MAG: flavodoxin [Acetatifactor sp.]|nr:flavodoxin [Acetatifactor sp.]